MFCCFQDLGQDKFVQLTSALWFQAMFFSVHPHSTRGHVIEPSCMASSGLLEKNSLTDWQPTIEFKDVFCEIKWLLTQKENCLSFFMFARQESERDR